MLLKAYHSHFQAIMTCETILWKNLGLGNKFRNTTACNVKDNGSTCYIEVRQPWKLAVRRLGTFPFHVPIFLKL